MKVTRVITRKVITDTDGLDPQLKSIMESRRQSIQNYKKSTNASSDDSSPRLESTSQTSVLAVGQIVPTNGHHNEAANKATPAPTTATASTTTASVRKADAEEKALESALADVRDTQPERPTSQQRLEDTAALSDTDTAGSSEPATGKRRIRCDRA